MTKNLLFLILLLSLIACDDQIGADYSSHSITLQLDIPESAQGFVNDNGGLNVTFTNKNKGYNFTAISDTSGFLIVESIESGLYDISVTEEFKQNKSYNFLNGRTETIINTSLSDSITLFTGNYNNNFLIKEYYYSGSLTPNKQTYNHDQFIEIYNNGDKILYADSILLVELESPGQSRNPFYKQQPDSIVVKRIWALPGNGTDYPIAPGKGYIMAQDPMNHRGDPNGNPNSPVDLSEADFDFWSDKRTNADIDFPAPNLIAKLWVDKGIDMVFHNRGGSAIALVKIPGNVDEYIKQNYITKGTATSSSKYYCKIPNKWVIDAIEATWNDKLYKRLDNSLDMGSTSIDAGNYSGLSVRRKIQYSLGGRVRYKDTNNSTEDFLHDVIPQPGIYE